MHEVIIYFIKINVFRKKNLCIVLNKSDLKDKMPK